MKKYIQENIFSYGNSETIHLGILEILFQVISSI